MSPPAAVAWSAALALCALGAVCAAPPAPPSPPAPPAPSAPPELVRRTRALSADRWFNLISEYTRPAGGDVSWFPRPIPVDLQLGGEGSRAVPMLVLPVPVPVAGGACPAAPASSATISAASRPAPPASRREPASSLRVSLGGDAAAAPAPAPESTAASAPPAPLRTVPRFAPVDDSRLLVERFRAQVAPDLELPPVILETDLSEDADQDLIDGESAELDESNSVRVARTTLLEKLDAVPAAATPGRRRRRCRRPSRRASPLQELLEADDERALQARLRPQRATSPPPPRFERPLKLRARLTVPRAGYTEPYTVWWDPASGASRVDFHGGTASSYRIMRLDGTVQSVLLRVDRTGAADVRRCAVSEPRRVSLSERALPALPPLDDFYFDGYVDGAGATRLERWRLSVEGRGGELGGARGEALTLRHELVVAREADNYTAVPIRYSVGVDSSVLGPDCDGYVHLFTEATTVAHDPAMFRLDIADACEFVQRTERMERLEPLREYTMLRRDPRHDAELDRYKAKYERRYADDTEEAVRKNLLIQNYRFTESGNRQGATFKMGANFLSDRLKVERSVLLGVRGPRAAGGDTLPFPHSAAELDGLRDRLPKHFDWRERGAVSPVRNQSPCSTCWAFAVVGAVEGALAVTTGRLVELSEQTLVDCGHPYGTHGCNGSWPSAAYRYVQEQGLPARDRYTPYQGRVLACDAHHVPPVTRISGHVNVTRDDILALKVAIKRHGPVVVIMDSHPESFASYTGGYYADGHCKRKSPNHAMLAVGWTTFRRETYFIVKNSWSTGWGERGYLLVRAPGNTCGVLRLPSYPELRPRDVHSVPAAARVAAPQPAL